VTVIFGWAPLQLIMEDDGQFSELCPDPLDPKCASRNSQFDFIFTVSSSLFALSVWPTGALLDRYGPRFSCLLGSVIFGAGMALVAVSDSKTFDAFLWGFCLISMGGPPIVLSFMHLSNLFPLYKGTIITVFNVMIDASSLVFVLLQLVNEAGVSRRTIFIAYCAVPAAIFVSAPFLWNSRAFSSPPPEEDESEAEDGEPVEDPDLLQEAEIRPERKDGYRDLEDGLDNVSYASHAVKPYGQDLTPLGFMQQVNTKVFVFGNIFTSLQLLRVNFYIGASLFCCTARRTELVVSSFQAPCTLS
jgi:MFS family permease